MKKIKGYNKPDFARSEREESMKNIRFDLELFKESGNDCAAEQFEIAKNSAPEENENRKEFANTADGRAAIAKTVPESYKRIGELLGLGGETEEELINALNQRRLRAYLSQKLKERNAKRAYSALISEADQLSLKQQGFDLKKELSDKRFIAMLKAGLTMEDAYRAVHIEELIKNAEENARRTAVLEAFEKIGENNERMQENGISSKAPAKSRSSVENLTGRKIRDILRRVENGAKIKF